MPSPEVLDEIRNEAAGDSTTLIVRINNKHALLMVPLQSNRDMIAGGRFAHPTFLADKADDSHGNALSSE
jgi:hypothetical protein